MKMSWNITHAKFKQHQFKNTARGGSGSKIANLEITLFMDGPRWPLLSGWIFCQLEEAAVDGANDKCILRSVGISENLEGGGVFDTKVVMIYDNLLTKSRHIPIGKFCVNIFLISIIQTTSESSKIAKFWHSSQFSKSKVIQTFLNFFYGEKYYFRSTFLLTFFEIFNFLRTSFSKLMSNFWWLRST